MNEFQAANAWDAKKTFLARNEVEALSCKNGKDSLADGQEVKKEIYSKTYTAYCPPIYLHIIFEILSLKNRVYEFDFSPSLNLI